jgi:hypothetical protein
MRKLTPAEQLRQAVIKNGQRPAKEQIRDMIKRGAIDERGRVLLVGPGCNDSPGKPDRAKKPAK